MTLPDGRKLDRQFEIKGVAFSLECGHSVFSLISKPKPSPLSICCALPLIGDLLKWRHARTLLQIPLFIISVAMILHGLFGPALAPRNLATTLTWVHFRGALVLVLLFAGNFFCLACPFMLVRNLARKFFRPVRNWPRRLRNKWFSIEPVCRRAFCLRVVRSVGVAVVDRVVDRRLLCGRAVDRCGLQTCDVLQIRLSYRPVQFCRFDSVAI